MSTKSDGLITSPVGAIQYMALHNKTRKEINDTEATVFMVLLEFDGKSKEAQEFKKAISAVNPGLIGTKRATTAGNFTVKASTQWYPKVINQSGDLVTQEEAPVFYPGSTGHAAMTVKAYTGNPMGGSLNLIGVALADLNVAAKPEQTQGTGGSSSAIVEKLRAALSKT